MSIDWSDPVQRAELIERVGPDKYNEMARQARRRSVVAFENGHFIRAVNSQR